MESNQLERLDESFHNDHELMSTILQSMQNKQLAAELYYSAYKVQCLECAYILAKAEVDPAPIYYMFDGIINDKHAMIPASHFLSYIYEEYGEIQLHKIHQSWCIPMIIGLNSRHPISRHPLYTRDVLRAIIKLARPSNHYLLFLEFISQSKTDAMIE